VIGRRAGRVIRDFLDKDNFPRRALNAHQGPRDRKLTDDSELRGTLRALSVLRALNRENGATIVQLHAATKIPRPSLYRLITTLCRAGYVRRTADQTFRLTYLVRTLSDGLRDEEIVQEVAGPILDELQRDVIWPTDLATFLNYAMYLRQTTRRHSPLTLDRATVGWKLPMLHTALGRAYIAYCPRAECEAILDALERSNDSMNAIAKDRAAVDKIIRETRSNGYGSRFKAITAKTGSIAIPLTFEDRVVACIGITFIASALTPAEAAARYLKQLKAAGLRIESAYADVMHPPRSNPAANGANS